jgi:predicted ATP-dependent serine protease
MQRYAPRPQQNSVSSNVGRHFGNFVGNGLSDSYNSARRADSLIELGLILVGGIGGYLLCQSKKTSDKLMTAGFGAMLGTVASQAWKLYSDSLPALEAMSPMQYGIAEQSQSQLQDRLIPSDQLRYMQIPSMNFSGTWIGDFIGESINSNFSMVLSGVPGGGKSHLASQFASILGRAGKTLIVLSEEGITNHVQERMQKYSFQNTSVIASKDPHKILQTVRDNGIQFLVIDSLQGVLSNSSEQVAFMRALKGAGLLGTVVILQVGKDGNAKGRMEIQHETDVMIDVEEGIATIGKNRFGASGKTWNIFASDVKVLPITTSQGRNNKIG